MSSEAKRPDQFVGEQVKRARVARSWKQSDLVDRLTELGFTQWRQSKVAKIESGEVKRLALEDVIALAAALSVQPLDLLAPRDAMVEVAPKVVLNRDHFDMWMKGSLPLSQEAEVRRQYALNALRPDDEVLAEMHLNLASAGLPTAEELTARMKAEGKR